MKDYYITYAQTDKTPGVFRISAANDDDAIVRLRRFIEQGNCPGSWGTMPLDDNREYQVRYDGGQVIGDYQNPAMERLSAPA